MNKLDIVKANGFIVNCTDKTVTLTGNKKFTVFELQDRIDELFELPELITEEMPTIPLSKYEIKEINGWKLLKKQNK